MLKIIEPQDHRFYKHTLQSFLHLLKIYHNCDLFLNNQEETTFVIAEDDKRGVFGGAVLCQQNVASLYEKIAKIILTLQPERQNIWLGKLCFRPEQEDSFTLETLNLYHSFYQDLYKAFLTFAEKKNIDFIALTLRYKEQADIRTYGYWPYLLEISSLDSSDNNFHALLDVSSKTTFSSPLRNNLTISSLETLRPVL